MPSREFNEWREDFLNQILKLYKIKIWRLLDDSPER